MNKGSLYALGAYVIWGFFPIYFKLLHEAPAIQVVAHRIVWSFILLAILLSARKEWKTLRAAITGPKMLAIFMISSILLAMNWLIYIYGVQAGYIVETSLGYFINPLVSVLLGVVISARATAPAAVGGGGPGRAGRALPDHQLWIHPVDRFAAGADIRIIWIGEKDFPARLVLRAEPGNRAAVHPLSRLPALPAEPGHGRVRS